MNPLNRFSSIGHLSSIRLIVEAQHALGIMSKKSAIEKKEENCKCDCDLIFRTTCSAN